MSLNLSSLSSGTATSTTKTTTTTTTTTTTSTPISVAQPIIASSLNRELENNNFKDDDNKNKILQLNENNSEVENIDNIIQNTNNENQDKTKFDNPIWEDDYKVKFCPKCKLKFTFFNRRHHCRKCGKIFCNKCSDNFCKFLPGSYIIESEEEGGKILVRDGFQNYKFRTCDDCYKEINMLKEALGIKADSDSECESNSDSENERIVASESGNVRDNENLKGPSSNLNLDSNNNNESEGDSTYLIKHSQPKEITKEINESTTTLDNNNNNNNNNKGEDTDELNECPICNINLIGMNEIQREEHINECLKNQEFGSPNNQGGLMKRDKNRMLVYYIPKDADMNQLIINEDNECVICLDEFHPGDKLGRLECLCCFHYKCIKDWIQKKGFCECPVHTLHSE